MTASAPADLLVPPAYATHPPYERTLGPEVADLCELAGYTPDPEQRLGLDLIFALRADGRSAALEVAAICSRQNLKTGLFKMAVLGWLFITDQRLVVWSAHEFSTAQEAFRDLTELIENSPVLSKRLKPNGISRANGDEAIELLGDRRLRFRARTKSGGRGLSGDKIVLDEAFALQPAHMGALLPTLSARPDPQVLYGSSAGLVDSAVLRRVRNRGRAGGDERLAYVEWCDDLGGSCDEKACDHELGRTGCRLDDRRRWQRANPAMGRVRANGSGITEDYLQAERRALTPAEFGRERLGWWDDPEAAGRWSVISEAEWRSRLVSPARVDRPAFGVSASWPDAEHYAIVVGGRLELDDGPRVAVQVIDHRPGRAWVPGRLRQLREEHDPIAVVMRDRGPTAPLHADLSRESFPLVTPWVKESAAAFATFYDAVVKGEPVPLGHFGEQLLDDQLAAADRERAGGDGWSWASRPEVDTSAIQAATYAAWGHVTYADQSAAEPWGFYA